VALRHRLSAVLPLMDIKLKDFLETIGNNKYQYKLFLIFLLGLADYLRGTQDP
jgi:hypothetical protein